MKYILEKKEFYAIDDIVLIEYWYNNIITPVVIKDIHGRKITISHNIHLSKIRNAPDEVINPKDIIQKNIH